MSKKTAFVKAYVKDVAGGYKPLEYNVEFNAGGGLAGVIADIYDKGVYMQGEDYLEFYPPEVILNIIVREVK